MISRKLNLREKCEPMSFAIGLKELWEMDPKLHQPGYVEHTLGWPLVRAVDTNPRSVDLRY